MPKNTTKTPMTLGRARTQITDMIFPPPPGGGGLLYERVTLDPQFSAVAMHLATPPPLSRKIICTINPTTKKKVILPPASEPFLGSQKCLVVLNLFPFLGAINRGLTEQSSHVRRSSTRHYSASFGNVRIRDRQQHDLSNS